MLKKIWSIFKVPSPKELGWSENLSLRDFNKNSSLHTWEDWEEKVQKEYPIRYFLSQTLPLWFNINIMRRLSHAYYWFVSHFIPSRRYHVLDLRQPKSDDKLPYRWGWLDSDTQILYALFNILNNFVKNEMKNLYCPSEEEVEKDHYLLSQRNNFLEIKAIHYWWNVDRKRKEKYNSELLTEWSEARKNNEGKSIRLWEELQKSEKDLQDKEDEMILRLIKIRHYLWT